MVRECPPLSTDWPSPMNLRSDCDFCVRFPMDAYFYDLIAIFEEDLGCRTAFFFLESCSNGDFGGRFREGAYFHSLVFFLLKVQIFL